MKAIVTLLSMRLPRLAKSLTAVTFAAILSVGAFAQGQMVVIAPSREATPNQNSKASYNQNVQQAQTLANAIYQRIQKSKEIGARVVAGIRDRWEYPCSTECRCLNKHFVSDLKAAGFEVRTIYLTKRGAQSIRLAGAPDGGFLGPSTYDYHYATAVQLQGRWFVIDPILIHSARLELYVAWKKRILSPVLMEQRR